LREKLLKSLLLNLQTLGFYKEFELPDYRSAIAEHDGLGHACLPKNRWFKKFIPPTHEGELFTVANEMARLQVRQALKDGRDPVPLTWAELYPDLLRVMRLLGGDELLALTHRADLLQFHEMCISFWLNHPNRDVLLALEAQA
jgi:hypothetical protein